eukprot:Clim_evm37s128 gene=Clim_evmTU37s128
MPLLIVVFFCFVLLTYKSVAGNATASVGRMVSVHDLVDDLDTSFRPNTWDPMRFKFPSWMVYLNLPQECPALGFDMAEVIQNAFAWRIESSNDSVVDLLQPFRKIDGENIPASDKLHLAIMQVVDNEVYLFRDETVDHKNIIAVTMIVLYLTETVGLPDMQFLFTSHDGSGQLQGKNTPEAPIFSTCLTSGKHRHILVPRPYHTTGIERWMTPPQGYEDWGDRINKAIFRGGLSSPVRADLYQTSKGVSTDLLDMGLVHLPEGCNCPETIYDTATRWCWGLPEKLADELDIPLKDSMTMQEQMQYRYVINADGVTTADRLPYWISRSDTVVIKQETEFTEYWYPMLEPGKNYIPVSKDWTDLEMVLRRLVENPAIGEDIREQNAQAAIRDLWSPAGFMCIWRAILLEYASQQSDPVLVFKESTHIRRRSLKSQPFGILDDIGLALRELYSFPPHHRLL